MLALANVLVPTDDPETHFIVYARLFTLTWN